MVKSNKNKITNESWFETRIGKVKKKWKKTIGEKIGKKREIKKLTIKKKQKIYKIK